MRPLLLLCLALCFIPACLAVENTWSSLQWSVNQPAPTLHNNSAGVPTDPEQFLRWGNSFRLELEPLWNDTFNIPAPLAAQTNLGNTTVFTITFSSTPPGALLFNPPSVEMRIYTSPGGTGSFTSDGSLTGSGTWWFSPTGSTEVQVTAVSQARLGDLDPKWWEFNITETSPLRPLVSIEMNATISCVFGSTPLSCGTYNLIVNSGERTFVVVDERPLLLFTPFDDSRYFVDPYTDVGTPSRGLPITYPIEDPVSVDSPSFVVAVPLETPDNDTFMTYGSPYLPRVQYFQPGRDNFGGVLSISLHSCGAVIENDTTVFRLENVSAQPQMAPPVVSISSEKPANSFKFTQIPWVLAEYPGAHVDQWICSFRVVESVAGYEADPSLIDDPSTPGTWPQGAYMLPSVQLQFVPLEFKFLDQVAGLDFLSLPISPQKTGSYRGRVFIPLSPANLGLGENGTITVDFQVSPPGAIRILVANNSDDISFAPVTSFVWSGYQRTIEYIMDTQDSPSGPLGVNWTFSDPVSAPLALDAELFAPIEDVHFQIVSNSFRTAIVGSEPDGPIENGVTPNQPFWLRFMWSPPTTHGFTVTVAAQGLRYPDGRTTGNITFVMPAGFTAFVAGPFVALEPSNLGPESSDVTFIPISVSLGNLTTGASDSTWFYVEDSPLLVRVRRDRLYIVSTPALRNFLVPGSGKRQAIQEDEDVYFYELSASGYTSEPFCIGVSLNSHFFADGNQEIWVTPWSETMDGIVGYSNFNFENRSGLIFKALDNPAPAVGVSRAGMPPGTVVLSRANNGTGCFTISFDRNWPFLSSPLSAGAQDLADFMMDVATFTSNPLGFWRVQAAIGGPDTGLVFERIPPEDNRPASDIVRLPPYFVVVRPSINFLTPLPRTTSDDVYFVGEQALIQIAISEPSQKGFNYALTCTACTFEQVTPALFNGAPGWGPGDREPHLWRISFTALPVPFKIPVKRVLDYSNFSTTLKLWTYGPDAAFFVEPPTIEFTVIPRVVDLPEVENEEVSIGSSAGPFPVRIESSPINGLTIRPVAIGGAPLVFDPPAFVFTPSENNTVNGSQVIYFTVGPDATLAPFQFGSWQWTYVLEGPDAYLFTMNEVFHQISVIRRPAPVISFGTEMYSPLLAGLTHGPYSIVLDAPLQADETELIITPRAGELTFEPASFRFTPFTFQQMFTVRYDPTPGMTAEKARVFWEVSGADSWKYDVPDPVWDILLALRSFFVKFDTSPMVYGEVRTMQISLYDPTPSRVTFRFLSDAFIFTPANITFTASSGLVQSLTYTLNRDTPYRPGGTFAYLFAVNTLGADAPYYKQDLYRTVPITISARTFVIEAGQEETPLPVFFLNRPSQMFTLSTQTTPTSDVTITFSSPYLRFSPSSLHFDTSTMSQTFSFTPILLFPAGKNVSIDGLAVDVEVAGIDAELYDLDNVYEWITQIQIVPEIDIAPIAPIYTDGSSHDILVSLKSVGALSNGLPQGAPAWTGFTVSMVAFAGLTRLDGVVIEPSTLEFSSSSTTALRSFRIHHTQPSAFDRLDQYTIHYYLRFGSDNTFSQSDLQNSLTSTGLVPIHARTVFLLRYNIIPEFPKVLSYWWDDASINLTRPCRAHLSLTPIAPVVDGQRGPAYGGHLTVTGRVLFDPPVIVFSPGQTVAHFRVKAARGLDAEHGYYRVDWLISGDDDDTYNFVDYVYVGVFTTFHMASSTVLQISSMVVLGLVAALLLIV